MDISTFLSTINVLEPFLIEMGARGYAGSAHKSRIQQPSYVFQQARKVGLRAEQAMFRHTNGINTHKGAIFSLGLLCTACGYCVGKRFREKKELRYPQASEIMECAGDMVSGIVDTEMAAKAGPVQAETAGLQLFRLYGVTGIRGEAERGFPTLRFTALPVLSFERRLTASIDIQSVQTLLHLITVTEDTNIIARGGFEALDYTRRLVYRALGLGGMHTSPGRKSIVEMNNELISLNISPGGSADLLAAAFFLTSI
jgi:triphosphoribosyl-dephospho-CoA synthase